MGSPTTTDVAYVECELEDIMSSDNLIPDMECIWYDSLADDFS
jgi:hypothetical protein